jgi:hypothetical protein
MTRTRASGVEQLVEELVRAEAEAAQAYARQDMKSQNIWADRREAAIQKLLSMGPTGRAALENLLYHDLPVVRGVAATHVRKWAPEKAVPVLEALLAWADAQKGADGLRPPIAGLVLFSAKVLLAQHYGIGIQDVVPCILCSRRK